MTNEKFETLRFDWTVARQRMCDEKSRAYTMGTDNRLVNFEELGKFLKVSPREVLAVYLGKHVMSLFGWFGGIDPSEGIRSTIADTQNYLDLLVGMLEEYDVD